MGGQGKPWRYFRERLAFGLELRGREGVASESPVLQPKGSRTSLAAGKEASVEPPCSLAAK